MVTPVLEGLTEADLFNVRKSFPRVRIIGKSNFSQWALRVGSDPLLPWMAL